MSRFSSPISCKFRLTLVTLAHLLLFLQCSFGSVDLPDNLPPGIDLELPADPGPGPGFLPRHGSLELLKNLASLAHEQPQQAVDLLKSWLIQRKGQLVFDGELTPWDDLSAGVDPIEIPPPEKTLSEWSKSLPPGFLKNAFRDVTDIPLSGSHPWIWVPEFESAALKALEQAIEQGDRQNASILLRRRGLAQHLPRELLHWVHKTMLPVSPFQSSIDQTPLVTAAMEQLKAQRWIIQNLELDLPRTNADAGQPSQIGVLNTRRSPLASVHGLIRDGVLVIAEDRRVIAVNENGDQLWSWPPSETQKLADRQPPAYGVRIGIYSGDKALFQLRSARLYQPPNTNLAVEKEEEKHLGWIEGHVLNLKDPHSEPQNAWTIPIVQEGFTLLPTPLWRGSTLFLVATRGFRDVETWVFAFDTDRQREVWRRKLETRRIDVHSFDDLRQLIGQTKISQYGGILSIDRSHGIVDRVCAYTGEHLSALLTPRFLLKDQPLSLRVHWGELRLQGFPKPRSSHRQLSVVVPNESLRICIPEDSRMILGLGLHDGRVRWHLPVGPGESILGLSHDLTSLWLADLHIERNAHQIKIRKITLQGEEDPSSRRTLPIGNDPISAITPPGDPPPEPEGLRPLLVGEPRYFSDRLLVPTVAGLEWFQLQSGDSSQFMPWPENSQGGNLFPWSEDHSRWGLIHRGDASRGTTSRLEVWSHRPSGKDPKSKD